MHVQNIGVSERQFLVTCQDKRETDQLLALGGQLEMNLGRCSISTPPSDRIPTPPPKPGPEQQPAHSKIQGAVRGFIVRVLMADCTPEETRILPVVLDRLYLAMPEGGGAP